MNQTLRTTLRILLPAVVLGLAVLGFWIMKHKQEPARTRPRFEIIPEVAATRLRPETYTVELETYGTVQPRTESTLLPEVSGQVEEVAANFRDGGFVAKGDVLLRIDKVDYETTVVVARGNVAQAKADLAQEIARGEQARDTWKRLGKSGQPSSLVLREPQRAEVEARLAASEAQLLKAQRDLERTEIRAPYDGRVLEKNVDVGQVVREGTALGRLFAVDVSEIRLPLTNTQLSQLNLSQLEAGSPGPRVVLETEVGGKNAQWEGTLVRVEGAIDQRTRQLHVVAQVQDPYGRVTPRDEPLKVGLFVSARIEGETLERVLVVPRKLIRPDGRLVLLDSVGEEYQLRLVPAEPAIVDSEHAVIRFSPEAEGGVRPGDLLCLTSLAFPAEGMAVLPSIDGVKAASGTGPKGPGGGRPGGGKGVRGGPGGGKGKGARAGGPGGKLAPAEDSTTSEATKKPSAPAGGRPQ